MLPPSTTTINHHYSNNFGQSDYLLYLCGMKRVYGVIECKFNENELNANDAYIISLAMMQGIQYPELLWNVVFSRGNNITKEIVKEKTMNRSFSSKLEKGVKNTSI
jgi:hypothetical protein